MLARMLLLLPLVAVADKPARAQAPSRLHIEQYVADSVSFNVVSALIVGPTEVMLIDAQMRMSDGRRVADMIAATGKKLTAIFVTHPDEDHTLGAQAIVSRFPGTPLFMTQAGVTDFARTAPRFLRQVRADLGADAPDSVITPRPIPSTRFTVDGETVEIIPDLQGDVLARTNSVVFVPSLRTVIAGDMVFAGVHLFLGNSTEATRTEWARGVERIAALQATVLIPGHKPVVSYPDSPAALEFMGTYLRDFEAARQKATNGPELYAAMQAKYPTLGMPSLLRMSAGSAFRRVTPMP